MFVVQNDEDHKKPRNVAVDRTKKSIDESAFEWLSRNVRHVFDGGFGSRGAHSGFSWLIRLVRGDPPVSKLECR